MLPISVPGCVDGWFAIHERFGVLPMETILNPAIKYSNEGFPLTEVIAPRSETYLDLGTNGNEISGFRNASAAAYICSAAFSRVASSRP